MDSHLAVPRYAAPFGGNRAASFRPHRRSPKKGASLLTSFLCFLLFFSFEAFPIAVDAASTRGLAYDCPLDCGTGGICVPDTTFGALSAQHHSETASFRCDCFAGFSGTLCQIQKDGAVANADFTDDSNEEHGDDDFLDFLFLPSDGCPFECQHGGKCMSIFGGISYGCLCIEPFWGSQCEVNGLTEPCELDCSSVVSTAPMQGIGINDASEPRQDASEPKQGAFCVESPDGVDDVDDRTCVHCEEIPQEDEPNCEGLIECKNGGVCKIDYQFTLVIATDPSEENDATTERPLKCSSTVTMPIDETTVQTVWMDLPPYVLSCDCQVGFQGETCEEIDVCGGCQNDGYCISKDTPGDYFSTDDIFNFDTNVSNFNDDDNNVLLDGGVYDDDNDDDSIDSPDFSDSDCTCYYGKCDQTQCGTAASCIGGMCNQDYLFSPMCPGGKCSQRHTIKATCIGGDCDQTSAVEATCTGSDCFYDDFEAQTVLPSTGTGTMPPGFEPFCTCGYGYYGELCQHTITTICLFDELGSNQLLHDFCLKVDGLCPLAVGGLFAVGERFCTNGGTCGNISDIRDVIMPTEPDSNDAFTCDCPSGFDGTHCEVGNTQAPSAGPTSAGPTVQLPTQNELVTPSASTSLPQKWHTLVFVVPFAVLSF